MTATVTAPAPTPKPTIPKLIHIAKYFGPQGSFRLLLLRKKDDLHYAWYEEDESGKEIETPVSALHIEEAIRLANRHWKNQFFQSINCGFKYSLPERDEHGSNALFHQMAASYATGNGVFFDDEVGYNCFVQFASMESREIWQKLKTQNRI